jgi:hypothetical protein
LTSLSVSLTQYLDLKLSITSSFIDALFATSYIFVSFFVESVTQNEANRFFRFCSSKFSENIAEKDSALFIQYLPFNFLIDSSRNVFQTLGSLKLEVIVRISQTVVVGLKIIIEYIAGVRVLEHSIHEFHIQLTASQKAFQNLDSNSSLEKPQVISF